MLLFQYKKGAIAPTAFRSFKISTATTGIDRVYSIATSGRDVYIPGITRLGSAYYGTLVKYTDGDTVDWKYRFDYETGDVQTNHSTAATDSDGNVYVIGVTLRYTSSHYYLTKFTSAGDVVWRKYYSMSMNTKATVSGDRRPGITIDSNDNVYVCDGVEDPTTDFPRAMVCKINPSTGAVVWSSTWRIGTGSATHTDYFNSIDTDAAGNVYATGTSYNGSDYEMILLKINPTTGARVWQRTLNVATTTEYGHSVSVSPAGNVHVCGQYGNPARGFVIKFDTDGTEQWRHGIVLSSALEVAYDLVVDSNDDVIVNVFFGGSSVYEYKLIKYSSTGTELWQYDIDGEVTSDVPLSQTSLTVDTYDNIFSTFAGEWNGVPGDPDDNIFLISCPPTGLEVGTYDGGSGRVLSVTASTDNVTSTNANAITLTSTATLNEDLATAVFNSVTDTQEQTPVDLTSFAEIEYPKQ